jgi:hypothetical protein
VKNHQADLRTRFIQAATSAKRECGAPDSQVVAAMLSAAHAVALRSDPTREYINLLAERAQGHA